MVTLDLLKSGSVTLDATGTGSVVVGPERGGERWTVTRIAITCTSALQTTVKLYRNIISTTTLLFGSDAGNNDVASGDPPLELPPSGKVVLVWSGGTPGSVASLVLEGKLTR